MLSGSNGIMGAADTVWLIERGEKKDGKTAACLHITGRDVNVDDLKLEFNAQTCIWKSLGSIEGCEADWFLRSVTCWTTAQTVCGTARLRILCWRDTPRGG